MRTLYLLTLALLATVASADTFSSVSVSAYVTEDLLNNPGQRVPGCGGDAQSSSPGFFSFACDIIETDVTGSQVHESYSGSAEAETGVGPYGIGASVTLRARGNNYPNQPLRAAASSASFSWSQDVIVRGAQGSGAALVTLNPFLGADVFGTFGLELFNEEVSGRGDFIIIPITFGAPYTNTMSGTAGLCDGFFFESCGTDEKFVSNLSFTDANGLPLPDASLEVIPEISSWLLLATCAVPIAVWRKRAGGQAPEPMFSRRTG